MKKLAIRRARVSDARDAAVLLAGLGREFQVSAARAARRILRASDSVFVAVAGGEAVGLIAVHSYLPIHADYRYGRIVTIVVRPDCKRLGVGRAMMKHAISFLRRTGCRKIELTSRVYRGGAHKFYRAMGFKVTSLRFSRGLGRS